MHLHRKRRPTERRANRLCRFFFATGKIPARGLSALLLIYLAIVLMEQMKPLIYIENRQRDKSEINFDNTKCLHIFANKFMYDMLTQRANRVQTGFRLESYVLARIKVAAREKHISANEYVNEVLKEATRDIESDEEREESRRMTEEFLDQFCGAWVGDETTEEIMAAIKSSPKRIREVPQL